MQFFTTIVASILALSSLVSAAPLAVRDSVTSSNSTSGIFVYKVDNVTLRKLNGIDNYISSIQFDISHTVGDNATVTCTPFDSTGNAPSTFIEGTLYSCGNNSPFAFAYRHESNGLILKYTMGRTSQFIGTATLNTVCRAGPTGPKDYVCTSTSPSYLTMVLYNGSL